VVVGILQIGAARGWGPGWSKSSLLLVGMVLIIPLAILGVRKGRRADGPIPAARACALPLGLWLVWTQTVAAAIVMYEGIYAGYPPGAAIPPVASFDWIPWATGSCLLGSIIGVAFTRPSRSQPEGLSAGEVVLAAGTVVALMLPAARTLWVGHETPLHGQRVTVDHTLLEVCSVMAAMALAIYAGSSRSPVILTLATALAPALTVLAVTAAVGCPDQREVVAAAFRGGVVGALFGGGVVYLAWQPAKRGDSTGTS
jgi:hypothetical protein